MSREMQMRYLKTGSWNRVKVVVKEARQQDSGLWRCRLTTEPGDYDPEALGLTSPRTVAVYVREKVRWAVPFIVRPWPGRLDSWDMGWSQVERRMVEKVEGENVNWNGGEDEVVGCLISRGLSLPTVTSQLLDENFTRLNAQFYELRPFSGMRATWPARPSATTWTEMKNLSWASTSIK